MDMLYLFFFLFLAAMFSIAATIELNKGRPPKGWRRSTHHANPLVAACMAFTSLVCLAVVIFAWMVVPS